MKMRQTRVKHTMSISNYNYTNLQLQLFLAQQLPEEIKAHKHQCRIKSCSLLHAPFDIKWKNIGGGASVTPREWDYVVRRVEEKLTDEQYAEYTARLEEKYYIATKGRSAKGSICAPWAARAITLSQTLNIPIE